MNINIVYYDLVYGLLLTPKHPISAERHSHQILMCVNLETYKRFSHPKTINMKRSTLSQENTVEQRTTNAIITEPKPKDEHETSIQELAAAMKSMADDVGQISELASEEKLLVTEFFTSLLQLMQPLTTAMPVSTAALPAEVGNVSQAYIDPTAHLALLHEDGHMELKNLIEERNREIMVMVIKDVMPKFKSLTSMQKRKIEKRIKFLSAVTNEIQKISSAMATLKAVAQK
jgi:hypothetical protein